MGLRHPNTILTKQYMILDSENESPAGLPTYYKERDAVRALGETLSAVAKDEPVLVQFVRSERRVDVCGGGTEYTIRLEIQQYSIPGVSDGK